MLSSQGGLEVFALVDATSGRGPPDLAVVVAELDEQRALILVEDECADRGSVDRLEPVLERAEPLESLGVGNRGVRGRSRREDEQSDVAESSLLRAVVRALAERAAVGLLADERDRTRPELEGDAPEPFGRIGEVAPA